MAPTGSTFYVPTAALRAALAHYARFQQRPLSIREMVQFGTGHARVRVVVPRHPR